MTRHQELKAIIVSTAALCYSYLPAKKAAEIIYASLSDRMIQEVNRDYPSYEEDSGDKACRCFTRWIQEDRKGR